MTMLSCVSLHLAAACQGDGQKEMIILNTVLPVILLGASPHLKYHDSITPGYSKEQSSFFTSEVGEAVRRSWTTFMHQQHL